MVSTVPGDPSSPGMERARALVQGELTAVNGEIARLTSVVDALNQRANALADVLKLLRDAERAGLILNEAGDPVDVRAR